jgi:hypothetical protein
LKPDGEGDGLDVKAQQLPVKSQEDVGASPHSESSRSRSGSSSSARSSGSAISTESKDWLQRNGNILCDVTLVAHEGSETAHPTDVDPLNSHEESVTGSASQPHILRDTILRDVTTSENTQVAGQSDFSRNTGPDDSSTSSSSTDSWHPIANEDRTP